MKIYTFLQILIVFMIQAISSKSYGSSWVDYYGQNVWLGKVSNPVLQHRLLLGTEYLELRPYAGLLLEEDAKTNASAAYTDSQIAMILGLQTKLFNYPIFPIRAFIETRLIDRLGSFPDQRKDKDWEGRFGLLGSGIYDFNQFYLKHYFSIFYTRLYGERIISEGWARQGYRLNKWLNIFHELYFDSYDLQFDRALSFDSRPGLSTSMTLDNNLYIESSAQYIRRWSEISVRGKDDWRINLIFAYYR